MVGLCPVRVHASLSWEGIIIRAHVGPKAQVPPYGCTPHCVFDYCVASRFKLAKWAAGLKNGPEIEAFRCCPEFAHTLANVIRVEFSELL